MANGDETVRDVCAEMNDARNLNESAIEDGNHLLSDWYYDDECQGWFTYFADRILAAYERDMAAKDAEIAQLVTECNRLKAALKPVMELHLGNEDTCTYDELQDDMGCSLHAVREAQRIAKEGGTE